MSNPDTKSGYTVVMIEDKKTIVEIFERQIETLKGEFPSLVSHVIGQFDKNAEEQQTLLKEADVVVFNSKPIGEYGRGQDWIDFVNKMVENGLSKHALIFLSSIVELLAPEITDTGIQSITTGDQEPKLRIAIANVLRAKESAI